MSMFKHGTCDSLTRNKLIVKEHIDGRISK